MLHFAGHWDQKRWRTKGHTVRMIFAMESKLIFLLLRQLAPKEATGAKPQVTTLRLTTTLVSFSLSQEWNLKLVNLELPGQHEWGHLPNRSLLSPKGKWSCHRQAPLHWYYFITLPPPAYKRLSFCTVPWSLSMCWMQCHPSHESLNKASKVFNTQLDAA